MSVQQSLEPITAHRPGQGLRLFAVVRFTLLEACRSPLPWLLLAALGCALAASGFAASLALTEGARFRAALSAGGLVLDTTAMMRVLDIQGGRCTVQGGARMLDIELAVRETGQALRMWPSTWRVATIAGFIAGGFGGVGSIHNGVLRDSGNLLRCRVVTVEPEPQTIDLFGDDIESIKTFDADTQRTLYPVPEIRMLPARGRLNGI